MTPEEYEMYRPKPDIYFMLIARVVSTRATCDRKHVGAVLVRDMDILSTGYNGAPKGMKHCDEIGHMMEDGHCVRTTHAEANAIALAAKHGTSIDGATIYTTASPCWPCLKSLKNAGVKKIVFGEIYRDTRISDFCKELKIDLLHIPFEEWGPEDKALPEDEAIKAAHPLKTGKHELYLDAMRLVGAKYSKSSLVELVNWQLSEIDELKKALK